MKIEDPRLVACRVSLLRRRKLAGDVGTQFDGRQHFHPVEPANDPFGQLMRGAYAGCRQDVIRGAFLFLNRLCSRQWKLFEILQQVTAFTIEDTQFERKTTLWQTRFMVRLGLETAPGDEFVGIEIRRRLVRPLANFDIVHAHAKILARMELFSWHP